MAAAHSCTLKQGSNVQRVLLDQVSSQPCLTDVGPQVGVELFQLPWEASPQVTLCSFWTKAALKQDLEEAAASPSPSDSLMLSRDGTFLCLPRHVGEGRLC